MLIALSTYVLFVASVPDETVSTPCILPVPPRVISPPETVISLAKVELPLESFIVVVFLPAQLLLQLSGEEFICIPDSAFK